MNPRTILAVVVLFLLMVPSLYGDDGEADLTWAFEKGKKYRFYPV